jgi:glycosyltransferase involved in cell wall biosynthesis
MAIAASLSVPKVVALIPAYNQVEQVTRLVYSALAHVTTVVVIDDGSTDRTAAAAALAGAVVIAHAAYRGEEKALRTGFAWARRHGADLAFTLDADGQHDPADIPIFLEAHARSGADLIVGQRRSAPLSRWHRWAGRSGRWLLKLALSQEAPDPESGYRLYSRRLLEFLSSVDETTPPARLSYEVEILARAAAAGFTIGWVPIGTTAAQIESPGDPLGDGLGFLSVVWRLWRLRRALLTH